MGINSLKICDPQVSPQSKYISKSGRDKALFYLFNFIFLFSKPPVIPVCNDIWEPLG